MLLSPLLAAAGMAQAADANSSPDSRNGRVLLLHGIARTPLMMRKLEKALAAEGFRTLNLAYPSRWEPLEQLADYVQTEAAGFIAEGDGPLHIVTHSMGGLVARAFITRHRPARLGRVVMLGPPNQGSEIADLLVETKFYKQIFGPAGAQLTTHPDERTRELLGPVDYELGIIAGDRAVALLSWVLIPGANDGKVSVERTKVEGMTDHVTLHVNHTFMTQNRRVIALTIRFLQQGRFDQATA